MKLLDNAQAKIGSVIAQRVRHMFKNRIGDVRLDAKELLSFAVNNPLANHLVSWFSGKWNFAFCK